MYVTSEVIGMFLQLIQTLAVIVALVYAWQQIKDARREHRLGALWNIFAEISVQEQRSSRGHIYKNRTLFTGLKQNRVGLTELPIEIVQGAYSVGNTFNRVGYLVFLKLIPEEVILKGYGMVVARSWIVLEPFVYALREERHEAAFMYYFEYLANRCFKTYVDRNRVVFSEYIDAPVGQTTHDS